MEPSKKLGVQKNMMTEHEKLLSSGLPISFLHFPYLELTDRYLVGLLCAGAMPERWAARLASCSGPALFRGCAYCIPHQMSKLQPLT